MWYSDIHSVPLKHINIFGYSLGTFRHVNIFGYSLDSLLGIWIHLDIQSLGELQKLKNCVLFEYLEYYIKEFSQEWNKFQSPDYISGVNLLSWLYLINPPVEGMQWQGHAAHTEKEKVTKILLDDGANSSYVEGRVSVAKGCSNKT